MSDSSIALMVEIGKLRLRIDTRTKENGRTVVIIADKGTNVMSVVLEDLVRAVEILEKLDSQHISRPPETEEPAEDTPSDD